MSELEFDKAMFEGVTPPERKRAYVVDAPAQGKIIVVCDEVIGGEDPTELVEAIDGIVFAAFDSDIHEEMTVYFDQRYDKADIVMAISQVLHNMYEHLAEEEYQGLLDKNTEEIE